MGKERDDQDRCCWW